MTFMLAAVNKRCLFISKTGCTGLRPDLTGPGDCVTIFAGSETPFVLHRIGDEYRLLGDSYIRGVM